VLLLKSDELSLVVRLLPTIGGTKSRAPRQIMETPNQPVGDSMQILSLFERFFEARPGHWGGWELETYPQVTQIEFVNAERTKANANVTIGYSGATVVLEKVDGKWRAVRLTNHWITYRTGSRQSHASSGYKMSTSYRHRADLVPPRRTPALARLQEKQ